MNNADFNNQSGNAQNNAPQVKIKGRKPDIEFHHVTEEDGQTVWEKVGAVWQNKEGYFSGQINGQKVVGQTREAKEALIAMRKQQEAAPENNPAPQLKH